LDFHEVWTFGRIWTEKSLLNFGSDPEHISIHVDRKRRHTLQLLDFA